jgi:uncharacterized protein (TIGR02246 family)
VPAQAGHRKNNYLNVSRRFPMISPEMSAVHVAIEAANQRFMQAFAQADAAGLASLYTEDGQLLPPGGAAVRGWQAIRVFWQAAMDSGISSARLEVVEVEDHGDTAIEVSRYTLLGADEQLLDRGKYIVIWKQERGQWKLHRDIFNSNGQTGAE